MCSECVYRYLGRSLLPVELFNDRIIPNFTESMQEPGSPQLAIRPVRIEQVTSACGGGVGFRLSLFGVD